MTRTVLAGLFATASVLPMMGFASTAAAQSITSRIDEITVTARKRGEESLQDVPATITAFGSETLDRLGVADFTDFAYQVPGLTFNDQGPGEKRYVLRGVQSAGQQQVAVYYDEVPLPGVQDSTSDTGSQTTDLKIFDVERVEILKGPQGTTFGANAQTGAVRFITKKPVMNEFQSQVRAGLNQVKDGETGGNIYGMVNLPLAEDVLALRAIAYFDSEGGYIDNVRLGIDDINWFETTGFRGILRYQPTDAITFDATVWLQNRENGGANRFHPFDSFSPSPDNPDFTNIGDLLGLGLTAQDLRDAAFFQTGDLVVGDYTRTGRPDEQQIYSGTLNWDMDVVNLTATGSLYKRDFDFGFDSSWILLFFGVGPDAPFTRPDLFPAKTDQKQDLRQTAFEVRLNSTYDSPLQWLVGGFYRERESNFRSFVPVVDPVTGQTFDPGTPFTGNSNAVGAGIPDCLPCVFARRNNRNIEEVAVFGEATLEFLDRFEFLVGLRWFQAEQSDLGETLFQFALFGGDLPNEPDARFAKEDRLIKKFQLAYKATDDFTVYGLASQGFRLGGTNQQGVLAVPPQFDSDELWNYEIGVKSTWLDGRMIVNAAGYYIDWENLQVAGQDPTGGFGFIGNAGAAEVWGAELEIFASPTPALDFTAGLAWLPTAELTEDQITDEVVAPGRAGDQLPRIPEITFNATAQYNWPMALDGWEGFLRGEYSYRDESTTQLSTANPDFRFQDSFDIANFRFGATSEDLGLTVTAFIENAFDERGDLFVGAANGEPTFVISNRPRLIGVEAIKNF